MTRLRLTNELELQIVAYIRAGGYSHIAAEAAGIPRLLFSRWLARGRARKARQPYRRFWLDVLQAKAQARLGAEMKAREQDPKFWLRYGPGKDAIEAPGWASRDKTPTTVDGLANGEVRRLLGLVLQVLAPFPDARRALVESLDPQSAAPPEPSTLVNINTPDSEAAPSAPADSGT